MYYQQQWNSLRFDGKKIIGNWKGEWRVDGKKSYVEEMLRRRVCGERVMWKKKLRKKEKKMLRKKELFGRNA